VKRALTPGRRDSEVQVRILDTAAYATATFKLTESVDFGATYQVASANEIRILGSVPMVWSHYKIPSPTFAGVASARGNGTMEFLCRDPVVRILI
jgi:hypothetical protein